MVQFYPWIKCFFIVSNLLHHTLSYSKTKENKILTKDKIEPQHIRKENTNTY